MTVPNKHPCHRCGTVGTFSVGVTVSPDWVCHRCQPAVFANKIAKTPTSELIEALITAAIEHHEGPSWRSFTPAKLQTIRVELDARIPARPWWTSP